MKYQTDIHPINQKTGLYLGKMPSTDGTSKTYFESRDKFSVRRCFHCVQYNWDGRCLNRKTLNGLGWY